MSKVIVIGAGPAGMMAALQAAKKHEVILLDGNERIGKKLFITGKGRCNVTNAKDISEFFEYIPGNPHFLYSSLYSFTNDDTMNFFEGEGIKLKVERGDRVFPESDKSSDIIRGLSNALSRTNVKIRLNSRVTNIKYKNRIITDIEINNEEFLSGDYFIVATGGASYPLTGSRGEGQKFAEKLGHNIISLTPALVPIEIKDGKTKDLMGLSLKNVEVAIKENNKKVVYKNFGEMLFTHFGVSGPLILSGSRFIEKGKNYGLHIDLKPALNIGELDKRIQKDFSKNLNKDFKNSLDELLPQKLIPIIIEASGILENKKVNEITKEERKNLVKVIKDLSYDIKGLRPIDEAIVTAGGVDIKEIDPSTLKSRIIDNLSFAGEVMDVDAFTGGYNVQIAFSTGFIAGSNI
ncbi:NAD(P)/FAD-dependent oxidoreductase [Clostridium chromiireducens]|uniref:NAD(P)/FAD-dependent oxidoreductase n=1 Tax=Clostridium chromiireducens TaxID=225345 RepID=A0A1V4IC10_9CLOT|nr:NAD(P)/FAD-dependent oxidoreductase [Clostridium chromiireducens]OPJ57469.1 soluble pyridine nucleotide transhydrogenase [Clostridium chromiireducens]RII34426.1 NAD(P)/FAD-dependent oxidoreductase [Clostridium chromiireducens]